MGLKEAGLRGSLRNVSVGVRVRPDSVVAQSNLYAWYPFENSASDETAGDSSYADTTDYSGNVSGATELSNGGVTDILTRSQDSGNFSFDGADDNILVPNYGLFAGTSSWSISVWVKDDGITGEGSVIFSPYGEADVILTANGYFGSGDNIRYIVNGEVYDDINITNDGWHHLVLTFSSGSGITYYRDGSQRDSKSSISSINSNGRDNQIGGFPFFASDQRLNGNVDDLRIYNKELTSTEQSEIYQNTKP